MHNIGRIYVKLCIANNYYRTSFVYPHHTLYTSTPLLFFWTSIRSDPVYNVIIILHHKVLILLWLCWLSILPSWRKLPSIALYHQYCCLDDVSVRTLMLMTVQQRSNRRYIEMNITWYIMLLCTLALLECTRLEDHLTLE